ncbi:MAG: GDSL-type esterase/lipase family protein [Alphaproteobacteria bacterium]
MSFVRLAAAIALTLGLAASAEAQIACGPFTATALDPPAPRTEFWAIPMVQNIDLAVKTQPYRVLFLGDSITFRWDMLLWDAKPVWDANMPQRGVLNAGVAGDRTEHLLWRLDHGTLDGPAPKLAIVLIGTNDLAHGRPPEFAAQGIRAILIRLRQKLPDTRILLLGLTPRGATPDDWMRQEVGVVNNLIQTCADKMITYADIGGVLLDGKGVLSTGLSPDLLHFNGAGYRRLAPKLDPLIDQLEK